MFHLKLLQLAQTMCVPVEIVAIGSDCAHFTRTGCNWLRLCLFHFKSLQLAQTMCVSVEIVVFGSTICDSLKILAISSDYACFA